MNPNTCSSLRRSSRLTLSATLLAAAGAVWAGPPTTSSAATSAAREAYRDCLLNALDKLPPTAVPMTVWSATDACAGLERTLTAALHEENPDRPLFAKSYALSLKDEVVSGRAPDAIVGSRSMNTVARVTRP